MSWRKSLIAISDMDIRALCLFPHLILTVTLWGRNCLSPFYRWRNWGQRIQGLSKFTFSELKIHALSHFVVFRLLLSMSHWRKKMDKLEEIRRRSILSIRAGPFMISIQNAWISSSLGRQVGSQDHKGPAQKLWGRQESPWLSSPAPGRLAHSDFGNCLSPWQECCRKRYTQAIDMSV